MLVLPDCTDSEFTDSWSCFALAPTTQLSHIRLDCTVSALQIEIFFLNKCVRPELYILRECPKKYMSDMISNTK